MLQVKKIVGNLLASNMYLLFEASSADCWLIDIGDFSALAKELPNDVCVRGVFLTHTHFDHIAGVNELCNMFPECKVYTSELGRVGLNSPKKNFSLYYEHPMSYMGDNVVILHEDDVINLFEEVVLNVVETPGHCRDCLSYYTEDDIFTGDSYIPGVPVVTKLPGGSKIESEESVRKIIELAKNRIIFPGHDVDKWVTPFL